MLGDVEVDWSVPRGWACGQCTRPTAPSTTCWSAFHCRAVDAIECRCWCLTTSPPGRRPPTGSHTDSRDPASRSWATSRRCWTGCRRNPPPRETCGGSSVFRISHRIVDAYGRGRGVRGRRCRSHPPPDGRAGHEHRHPGRPQPGLEVGARGLGCMPRRGCWTATTPSGGRSARRSSAGRCAAHARASVPTRPTPDFVIRREAQLLIDYDDSPIVTDRRPAKSGPEPLGGDIRHRPAAGSRRNGPDPRRGHRARCGCSRCSVDVSTPCCCMPETSTGPTMSSHSSGSRRRPMAAAHGRIDVCLIAAPDADVATTVSAARPRQREGFRPDLSAAESATYVVRPDGYVSFAATRIDADGAGRPPVARPSAQACRPRRRPTCGSFAAGWLRREGGVAG